MFTILCLPGSGDHLLNERQSKYVYQHLHQVHYVLSQFRICVCVFKHFLSAPVLFTLSAPRCAVVVSTRVVKQLHMLEQEQMNSAILMQRYLWDNRFVWCCSENELVILSFGTLKCKRETAMKWCPEHTNKCIRFLNKQTISLPEIELKVTAMCVRVFCVEFIV